MNSSTTPDPVGYSSIMEEPGSETHCPGGPQVLEWSFQHLVLENIKTSSQPSSQEA